MLDKYKIRCYVYRLCLPPYVESRALRLTGRSAGSQTPAMFFHIQLSQNKVRCSPYRTRTGCFIRCCTLPRSFNDECSRKTGKHRCWRIKMKRNLVIATLAALALSRHLDRPSPRPAGLGAPHNRGYDVVEIPQVNSCKDTSILNPCDGSGRRYPGLGPVDSVAANVGIPSSFPDESVHIQARRRHRLPSCHRVCGAMDGAPWTPSCGRRWRSVAELASPLGMRWARHRCRSLMHPGGCLRLPHSESAFVRNCLLASRRWSRILDTWV